MVWHYWCLLLKSEKLTRRGVGLLYYYQMLPRDNKLGFISFIFSFYYFTLKLRPHKPNSL